MFKRSKSNLLELIYLDDENTDSIKTTSVLKDVDGYDIVPYSKAIELGLGVDNSQDFDYICVYYLNGTNEFFREDLFDVIMSE